MPKRPHMSLQVKLEACLHALGLDPKAIEWHHQPPLSVRPYDEATGKWTPDANDPRYIEPMASAAHRERSKKDTTVAAKTVRQSDGHREFIARILAKEAETQAQEPVTRTLYKDMKKKIPSRPFQRRKK